MYLVYNVLKQNVYVVFRKKKLVAKISSHSEKENYKQTHIPPRSPVIPAPEFFFNWASSYP